MPTQSSAWLGKFFIFTRFGRHFGIEGYKMVSFSPCPISCRSFINSKEKSGSCSWYESCFTNWDMQETYLFIFIKSVHIRPWTPIGVFNPSQYQSSLPWSSAKVLRSWSINKTLARSFQSSVIRLWQSLLRNSLSKFLWQPQVWGCAVSGLSLGHKSAWYIWNPLYMGFTSQACLVTGHLFRALLLSLVQTPLSFGTLISLPCQVWGCFLPFCCLSKFFPSVPTSSYVT